MGSDDVVDVDGAGIDADDIAKENNQKMGDFVRFWPCWRRQLLG